MKLNTKFIFVLIACGISLGYGNTQPYPSCEEDFVACLKLANHTYIHDCGAKVIEAIDAKIEKCHDAYDRNKKWFGTWVANLMLELCIDFAYGQSHGPLDECEQQLDDSRANCDREYENCLNSSTTIP